MSDVVVLRRESVVEIVRATPNAPVVSERPLQTVVIQRDGIPGARGERGPAGTVGDPFIYTPPDVSGIWNITHNLDRYPIVTVLDALGRLVEPDITYLDTNIVRLDFDIPMTGTAYLN